MGSLFENLNIGIWAGFIIQVIGRIAGRSMGGDMGTQIGLVITLLGVVIFVWGCMRYAVDKGYSKWLGLLGLFSCIGFIVLLVLPEKS